MINRQYEMDISEDTDITVLVIDNDQETFDYIAEELSTLYKVVHSRSAEEAYPILLGQDISIMICSEYLPGENGIIFMARMNKEFSKTQPVLMSEGITEDLLAFAINDVGVLKYLKKPLNKTKLLDAVSGAEAHYLKAVANEKLHINYQSIVKETQSLPYMARRIQEATPIIMSNIGTSATAASGTLFIMFAIIAILGVALILGIYSFKSILGIDIFSGSHFSDLFG